MATSGVSEPQSTNPRLQDHHPVRRSSARRKANGGCDSNKNKQRRRGMGIAKLEQQIFHDMWKTTAASSAHHHRNPASHHGLSRSDHRLLRYQDSNFLGPNCHSLHCNVCHKKKKTIINGEDLGSTDPRFLVLDNGNKMKQDNLGSYGKKVEVVAVHRKGGSSNSGDGVLMEYDFFPSRSIDDSEKCLGISSSSMAGFDVDLSLKLSY